MSPTLDALLGSWPSDPWLVITILVLVVLSRKRLHAAPEGLIRTLANAPVR